MAADISFTWVNLQCKCTFTSCLCDSAVPGYWILCFQNLGWHSLLDILCFLTVNRISPRCQPFVCWIHHLASHHHIPLRARRSAQIILVTGSNERTVYPLRIAILFAIPSLPFSKETEPSCSPFDSRSPAPPSRAPRDLVPPRLLRRASPSAPPPPARARPTVADHF